MIDRFAMYRDTELLLDDTRRQAREEGSLDDRDTIGRVVTHALLTCAVYAARRHGMGGDELTRIILAELAVQAREEHADSAPVP